MHSNCLIRITGITAALLLLGPTFATAEEGATNTDVEFVQVEENAAFTEWDADGSGDIDQDEWTAGFDARRGLRNEEDIDRDGALSEDEYTQSLYRDYDGNGDNIIDTEEWSAFQDDAGDGGLWDL